MDWQIFSNAAYVFKDGNVPASSRHGTSPCMSMSLRFIKWGLRRNYDTTYNLLTMKYPFVLLF